MGHSSRQLLAIVALCLAFGGAAGRVALAVDAPASPAAAAPSAPFADAQLAPPDTQLYMHVRDAAALRRLVADRPLGEWIKGLLDGDAGAFCAALSRAVGMSESDLFDFWLGRSATLITRRAAGGRMEWVLLTDQGDVDRAEAILASMRPTNLPPQASLPVRLLPDQHLLASREGNRYIIGSSEPRGLFDEMLRRWGSGAAAPSLADEKTIAMGRALAAGPVEVFYRHGDALYAGSSVLVAQVDGPHVTVHHRACFEDPPFARPPTKCRWNRAPLDAFEDHALVAMIEPTDIGEGRFWKFLEQVVLRWPLLSDALRGRIDDCRILALSEVDGRMEPGGMDMLVPAGVLALKLKCKPGEAQADLDASMLKVVDSINSLGEGSYLVDVPQTREMPAGLPRHVDLSSAMDHLTGGFPIMRSVSLDWTVAGGPNGSFCLIGTHPQQLRDAARAIRESPAGAACIGDWSSCGTLDGEALGRHLGTYAEHPGLFTRRDPSHGDAQDPEQIRVVQSTMRMFSGLASSIERCRWQMRRPCERTMELEVQITLAGSHSAIP
jgi:hypothetical protein